MGIINSIIIISIYSRRIGLKKTIFSFLSMIFVIVMSPNTYAVKSLIHEAAKKGDISEVRSLLSRGAHINDLEERTNSTPLHYAVIYKHKDLVCFLLERRANPSAVNICGHAVLHCAVNAGDESIIKLLLKYGADLDAVDRYGQTPKDMAINGHASPEIVALLIPSK